MTGKKSAKTGDRPGVTRGKQWLTLTNGMQLLDTPGILWPKFEDQIVGMHLAFVGSMNDEIIIIDELAIDLLNFLKESYPVQLKNRYELEELGESLQILVEIAKIRRCFKKGEELDYEKAASILIDDFRSGKLGRISIEAPQS